MAQSKKPGPKTDGNDKSSGKSAFGGAPAKDMTGDAALRGERPSPSRAGPRRSLAGGPRLTRSPQVDAALGFWRRR